MEAWGEPAGAARLLGLGPSANSKLFVQSDVLGGCWAQDPGPGGSNYYWTESGLALGQSTLASLTSVKAGVSPRSGGGPQWVFLEDTALTSGAIIRVRQLDRAISGSPGPHLCFRRGEAGREQARRSLPSSRHRSGARGWGGNKRGTGAVACWLCTVRTDLCGWQRCQGLGLWLPLLSTLEASGRKEQQAGEEGNVRPRGISLIWRSRPLSFPFCDPAGVAPGLTAAPGQWQSLGSSLAGPC